MASDERVQVGLEELQDLKGVWSELAKIWEKVDEEFLLPVLNAELVECRIFVSNGLSNGTE